MGNNIKGAHEAHPVLAVLEQEQILAMAAKAVDSFWPSAPS